MSEGSSDDQVGYGKPPRHSRFRKGQSGNPRGRPKGSQSAARLARSILNEKIVIRENGKRRAITRREAMLKQLANKGVMGDLRSIREVLNLDAAGAEVETRAKPLRIELVPVEPVPYRLRNDVKPGEPE
ncbi:MAG TPA: DUF5681 domain-containing protein [Stellaceae bacterium]|jgi:hypothetical protein|nr:DUF5681 domain-containing protein [Stellaceae bacterium]